MGRRFSRINADQKEFFLGGGYVDIRKNKRIHGAVFVDSEDVRTGPGTESQIWNR
jgi:hypothetical protein